MHCLLFLLILILASCDTSNHFNTLPFPELIDSIPLADCRKAKAKKITTAKYDVLYIGPIQDSIFVNRSISFYPPPSISSTDSSNLVLPQLKPNPMAKYYSINGPSYPSYDTNQLEVIVDTQKIIPNLAPYDFSNYSICCHYYPVYISNKTDHTVALGLGYYLPIILEAMNKDNEWQVIQKPRRYRCGVGLGQIILPPQEIILSSCPIFEGEFETKLRLRLGDNYSAPFYGTIHLDQFKDKK